MEVFIQDKIPQALILFFFYQLISVIQRKTVSQIPVIQRNPVTGSPCYWKSLISLTI